MHKDISQISQITKKYPFKPLKSREINDRHSRLIVLPPPCTLCLIKCLLGKLYIQGLSVYVFRPILSDP